MRLLFSFITQEGFSSYGGDSKELMTEVNREASKEGLSPTAAGRFILSFEALIQLAQHTFQGFVKTFEHLCKGLLNIFRMAPQDVPLKDCKGL